ncbi:ENTH/VHS family protein [Wolffia australiana]
MNGTFNGQILVDKLTKLNCSQQSIETLSHWCIFHRKNAKQVVETWDRQFHCSPKSQWVSFLYLANDILQNSRRKGLEFVNEFWKVLPDVLNNVMDSGDEFGRSAAFRLVDIWDDRKVFGSRGQALKDEIFGRKISGMSRNVKSPNSKLNPVVGDELQKLVSGYQRVYESPVDERMVLNRCQNAMASIEKFEKDIVGKPVAGAQIDGTQIEELEGQHMILRECIEELRISEASRCSLVSYLREALHEQESKLEQVRQHLQASQLRLEQAESIRRQMTATCDSQLPKEAGIYSDPSSSFIQGTVPDTKESRKSAAAAVAAKLTASTASAEMLSYVLSSLASEGKVEEASSDAKRPRIETNPPPPYIPQQASSHLSSPHPPSGSVPAPPLPPPPAPPLPPMPPHPHYVQMSAVTAGAPYGYGSVPLQRPHAVQSFSIGNSLSSSYMGQPGAYQGFTQQPPLPTVPPPQQQSASRQ